MKFLKLFRPLLIALITALFYLILYTPALDSSSPDFVTSMLSFFSMLGWSSVIIFTLENRIIPLIIYGIISFAAPLILFFTLKGYMFLHSIGFVLFTIAFIGLRIYIGAHVDYERKKRRRTRKKVLSTRFRNHA